MPTLPELFPKDADPMGILKIQKKQILEREY
jgi:hypothetical protein